jgi:hypothetical protein
MTAPWCDGKRGACLPATQRVQRHSGYQHHREASGPFPKDGQLRPGEMENRGSHLGLHSSIKSFIQPPVHSLTHSLMHSLASLYVCAGHKAGSHEWPIHGSILPEKTVSQQIATDGETEAQRGGCTAGTEPSREVRQPACNLASPVPCGDRFSTMFLWPSHPAGLCLQLPSPWQNLAIPLCARSLAHILHPRVLKYWPLAPHPGARGPRAVWGQRVP